MGRSITNSHEVIIEPEWRKWEPIPGKETDPVWQSKSFFREYEKYRLHLVDQESKVLVERVAQSAFMHWVSAIWESFGGKPLGERVTNSMEIKLPLDQRMTLSMINENKKRALQGILCAKVLDTNALLREFKPPPTLAELAESKNIQQKGSENFQNVHSAVSEHFLAASQASPTKPSFMERLNQVLFKKLF